VIRARIPDGADQGAAVTPLRHAPPPSRSPAGPAVWRGGGGPAGRRNLRGWPGGPGGGGPARAAPAAAPAAARSLRGGKGALAGGRHGSEVTDWAITGWAVTVTGPSLTRAGCVGAEGGPEGAPARIPAAAVVATARWTRMDSGLGLGSPDGGGGATTSARLARAPGAARGCTPPRQARGPTS
jgi:hypothetical protein